MRTPSRCARSAYVLSAGVFIAAAADLRGAVMSGGAPNASHPTLQVWLDASFGVTDSTGGVSAWEDRSSSNHDAAQTNEALRPTYVASNPDFADRPTLSFSGLGDVISTVDDVFTMGVAGTGDRTVFVVFTKRSDSNRNITGFGTESTGQMFDTFIHSGDMSGHYHGGGFDTIGGGPVYTAPQLAVMTHEYDSGVVSTFGRTTTGTASDSRNLTLNTGNSVIHVGAGVYGSYNSFNGDIAEVLIYGEALADADRLAVQEYLWTKYTTPVPEPASAGLLLVAGATLAARRYRRRA